MLTCADFETRETWEHPGLGMLLEVRVRFGHSIRVKLYHTRSAMHYPPHGKLLTLSWIHHPVPGSSLA